MTKKLKSLNPIIGTGYKTLSTIKDGEDGNIENFPDTLPKIPRLSYKRLGVSGLEIGWEFEDKIYYTYELYGSTTKGFKASEENLIFQGLASSYFYEAKPGEKWYFKARAKNTHGRYTEFSSELVTYTIKLDNLGDYVEGESINGALIENATINNAHIKDLHADKITAGVLDADRIGANSITANKIEANAITSEKIQANAITTGKLAANIIASNHIQSGTITSGHIKADTIESGHIKSNSINSNHIQANTIQSEHIQTGAITAGSGIIAEGAIGSAQISSLDANKINAGEIDTSKVKIKGENGFLFIENNTLYVVDNNRKIRCELGVIENNSNYGFVVRGADGQTIMLDHNGVHNAGITDGAIDNRKVSENANISGKKLDIDSVVKSINDDGSVTLKGTKVQIGNATLDVKLSEQTNLITEQGQKLATQQSEITANTNAIKLKVDNQTYTEDKKNMTSSLNKATSDISVLQGEIALKVEQTDIENAVDELSDAVNQRINETKAEIKATTDSISQRVSSNESSLNTTTLLAKAMSNGKMLYTDPMFKKGTNSVNVYNNSANGTVTVTRISKVSDCPTTSTHCIQVKTTGTASPGNGGFYQHIQSRANAIFIQKILAKVPTGRSLNVASNSMGDGYSDRWLTSNKGTGKWEEYIREVRCGSTGTFSGGGHVYVSGASPTTSSPLVWYIGMCTVYDITDSDERITNLTGRVSTAESKLTKDSLTTTIGSHYTTPSDVNGIVTNKGYATTSEVKQTTDALSAKFSSSGGYNLIRNSTGANGTTTGWTHSGSSMGTSPNENISAGSRYYMYLDNGTTTGERYAFSSRFKLLPNKVYRFTGYFHNYTACTNFDVFVLGSTTLAETDTSTKYDTVTQLISTQNTNGSWKKYTLTFTTPANVKSGYIRIDNNGYNSSGSGSNRIHWHCLTLTEGELEVPWSPHPSEVYDGITTIDRNGVKVSQSNYNGYTQMKADGFYVNNGSENVISVTSGGATFKGKVTIQSGSTVPTSTLSGTISSSQLNSTITSDISTAKTNASTALSTANTAKSTANTAKSTADTAKTTATTASTNATNAVNTANTANTTANSAKTTATTAQNTANTANTNATTALNTANSVNTTVNNGKTNWNNAYNRVNEWAYGAVTGSTTIDGGLIQTDTILANKICLGDTTNLCLVNPDTANLYGATIHQASDYKLFKFGSTTAGYYKLALNNNLKGNCSFKVGDIYRVALQAYASTSSGISIILRATYSDGTWANLGSTSISLTTSRASYEKELKVTSNFTSGKTPTKVELFLETNNHANYVYVREIIVNKKATGELIVDGSITAGKISSGAITTDKLGANAVTAAKIAANTITASQIASGAIATDELAANAVTAAKIAAGTITSDRIASRTITADRIKAGAITANEIASRTITASEIASNAITADKIASNSITSAKIASNSITSAKIASGAITANMITSGTMSANRITGGTLKSTNGNMYFDMDDGYMILYNGGTKVGQTLMNNISGTSIYGISNGCEYGSYSTMSAKTSSSASTYTMMLSVAGNDLTNNVKYGVNLGTKFSSHGHNFNLHNTYLCFGLGASSYSSAGQIRWYSDASNYSWIGITSSSYIGLFGQGGFRLGTRSSSTNTSYFGAEVTADSYSCKAHIWNNLNMHNWKIRYCQGVSTASLEINEEIPFARSASSDGEEGEILTNSYNVVKTKQNIVETMGSVAITEDMVDKEVYIELDAYMAYKNYMVILSPVGEDRKVCVLRKEDDGFYIKGNKGEVDYIIKYECIDVARYRNSTGEDAPENIVEEKENEPKPIILEEQI